MLLKESLKSVNWNAAAGDKKKKREPRQVVTLSGWLCCSLYSSINLIFFSFFPRSALVLFLFSLITYSC